MSRFACTILALLAIANTGAYAASNYADLANTGLSATVNVGGAGTGTTDCGAAQLAGAHADTITVAWSGFTANNEATVSIKLCYTDDKIVERPWRKYNGAVDKNKQCWQIPELTKFLKKGVAVGDGSTTIEIPTNTPPSTYYVQVLGLDSTGAYVSYANSDQSSCKITVKSYDRTPANLVGVQAFFTVFSIAALIGTYIFDLKRQEATYKPYVQGN